MIGAVQREGGKVRLRVIPNTRSGNVLKFVEANVDASAIYTDELKSYVGATWSAKHEAESHKMEEWVRATFTRGP